MNVASYPGLGMRLLLNENMCLESAYAWSLYLIQVVNRIQMANYFRLYQVQMFLFVSHTATV